LATALRITILSIVIFGLIYPFVMTGLAQLIFPKQANGSLVERKGKIVASDLVGALWTRPQYFQGRPSSAGKNGYDPTSTGGTNLGPSSKKLIDSTKATIGALEKANPDAAGPPPMDLVTSSGSGIDPDISPASAYWEAPRVAAARKLPLIRINALISAHVHERELGFLGEPHVNVTELNLALDGGK
ncbi:MAG TPA: potassium-transporting ATPase subunit KdpC, partial [Candidatus Baltobacteraceae bacterium]